MERQHGRDAADGPPSADDQQLLAQALAKTRSVVETWLGPTSSKQTTPINRSFERYTESPSLLAQPSRLGIGATAQHHKTDPQDSVFANYQLKMQLTGSERQPRSTPAAAVQRKRPLLATARKLPKPSRTLERADTGEDEEESRAKSVGRTALAPTAPAVATSYKHRPGRRRV